MVPIASLWVMAMLVTNDVDGHGESMVVVVVDGLEEMFEVGVSSYCAEL